MRPTPPTPTSRVPKTRTLRNGHLAFAVVALFAGSTWAGDLGTVVISRDTVTVGDPIDVQIQFTAPHDYRMGQIYYSYPKDTLYPLDDSIGVIKEGDSTWTVPARIALFATGHFAAGPQHLLLFSPTGDSMYVLFPPESVVVASVLPAEQDSIAPAGYKGLIKPPARFPWWMWLILIVVAVGVLALVKYFRKPRVVTIARAAPQRPPWEIAMDRLDHLAEQKHHLRGEARPFAIELSEILREYLEDRYGFVALEQVTSEINTALRHVALLDPQKDAVLRVLSGCDLAKYAKFHWPAPELHAALNSTRQFVTDTTPVVAETEKVAGS
jgi:hypothetical protein